MAVSAIAGNYPGGIRMTCILDEGAPTYAAIMNADGTFEDGWTFATPLKEGQIVALSNDTANIYTATGGLMVVERPVNAEALIIGQIVSSPTLVVSPTSTDADTDTLAERLAGKYYRIAEVEVWPFRKITKATVTTGAGAYHAVPGVATTLNYDISNGIVAGSEGLQLVTAAANGVGIVPLTYVADGGTTTFSCLVGITGFGYAVS
jgi:hypothetical protein